MPAVPYNSLMLNLANGAFSFGTGTFKAMMVGEDYVPDVDAHNFRDDVTDEIAGTGYTAGGVEVDVVVSQDNANDRVLVAFADATIEEVTFTGGAGVVIYHSRGGLPSADELVTYSPFNALKNSSGGDFLLKFGSPLRLSAVA